MVSICMMIVLHVLNKFLHSMELPFLQNLATGTYLEP
jgi:hypothetical protein